MQRHQAGRLEQAQYLYQSGNALTVQGKTEQAVACYERALSLKPDYAEAHNGLGLALAMQGQIDQAIAHFSKAVTLRPNLVAAHNNLGNALSMQGKMDEAVLHYERALSLQPGAAAHNNLGLLLAASGKLDQAVLHYERALALKPDHADAHINLGNAFRAQGQLEQAILHYERALALRPDHALAYHTLGGVLALQGKPEEALIYHERALSLKPHDTGGHDGFLLTLNYLPNQDPLAVYAAHRDYARRWEAPLSASIQPHANDRSPTRRLRIGYVSCDFRQHSVGYFLEPVLAHHDHDRFEIFCYANHLQEDEVTGRLKSFADHWRRLIGLSDEQAADRIRDDQIDILVDLNGHTGHNRLLVFARKPAPLQITWLGYPNTTGLSAMDYRLTDGFADPVGMTEHLHSEKLVRLPECFSCYQAPREAPEVSELPAREKGYVTFGSFNNLAKITREVMAVWARILLAVPGARLTLKNPALGEITAQQMVRKAFTELGIAPERLELLGHDPSPSAHLERYRGIDIGLDSFPYNGTTTTCEALWMGVPVVVLAGRTHAGRVGVSLLSNLGLTEFIAHAPEEYLATAVRWANDLERLSALRKELRSRMAASRLMDGPGFTKKLEQAYRGMWEEWCSKC
jgi:predicted O-linked N-acetylglucosamine transferase (SPINDLY family)